MPEGWEVKWAVLPPALDSLGAQQAQSVFMENGLNTASHTIYRYSNRWLAAFRVRLHREVFFPSSGWDWSELAQSQNLPLQADDRQIRCGEGTLPILGNRCGAVLRYGPYLSDFSSSMEQGVMSIGEFEQIVLKIDDLFSSCLK